MNAVSLNRPLQVKPSFDAGRKAYPFTFETGRRAANLWLSGDPAESLADFRDSRWRAYASGCDPTRQERQAFNEGFSKALADHIAGGLRRE